MAEVIAYGIFVGMFIYIALGGYWLLMSIYHREKNLPQRLSLLGPFLYFNKNAFTEKGQFYRKAVIWYWLSLFVSVPLFFTVASAVTVE